MAKIKKPARKPALSPEIQSQIRTEYSLGTGVVELSRKYDRSKSIMSRICKGIGHENEKLANSLADINQEIGTRKEHDQHLILQRSKQIQKIKDGAIKGTSYVMGRTLKKLQGLEKDDEVSFQDLNQAQGVITKANAIVEPKMPLVNVNTQINNNVQMSKTEVKAELIKEEIPADVLNELGYLDE